MPRPEEQDARRATVQQWVGAQDLLRLQQRMRCSSPDPRAFRAESRTYTSAGIALTEWRSTSLTGTTVASRGDGAAVRLMLVLAGGMRCATPTERWEGGPHSVHLLRGDEPLRWSFAHGTHLLGISLHADHLPPQLRRPAAAPSGLLPASKLVVGFAAALEHGVSAAADVHGATVHLARGLQELAVALLEERAPIAADESVGLRDRILEHIELHLSEQRLNPRTIADAFGVSLRWVHQAFNTGDTSLARHIRHRRVDSVAETLRTELEQPRLSLLAIRFGFSGREQLARCFRARYGVTVNGYHELVLDHLPLPEPTEDRSDEAEVA